MGKLADYIGKYWAGAEVMYAVIIAMTFTAVLWNVEEVPDFIEENIVQTAFACCVAWGLADGCFYIWERKYLMKEEERTISLSKDAAKRDEAVAQVSSQLNDTILRYVDRSKKDRLYRLLVEELSGVDEAVRMDRGWAIRIVLGTVILSAVAGAVVLAPIYLLEPLSTAMLVSNISAIALLFLIGYNRQQGRPLPVKLIGAAAAATLGLIIALITTYLGG